MSSTSTDNGLIAVTKEDGVVDLVPMTVRANFARALLAERDGNDKDAEMYLDLAIAAEIKSN